MLRFIKLPAYVLAGLLVLALVAPSAGDSTTIYTRYDSCPGVGFYPTTSTTPWGTNGTERHTNSPATSATFRCAAALPHGAVLKAVEFYVHDSDPNASISCGVGETGNTSSATGITSSVASGVSADSGDMTLATTTSWTIDRTHHAYFYECFISGAAPDEGVGIYGVSAKFRISAIKG
jgi:hypothetical protein